MSITTSSVYGIHLACAHPAKPASHQKTLHEDCDRVLVLLRHCRALWIFVFVVCAISASFAQASKRPVDHPGTGGGGCGSSVGISPRTSNLFPIQQQQFTASVSGSTNTQVSWQFNGATGGTPAGGSIDPNGLYTAPTIVPNPPTVTVSAISQADVTKSASATVAIQSSTPSGTFTISITAAVGTSTQTTAATLTVQ
jgi:hypothetical protein